MGGFPQLRPPTSKGVSTSFVDSRKPPRVLISVQSFAQGLLEAPHYTRPPEFRGWAVPEVLVSGNHPEVARWRRLQNLLLTARRRPDLLASLELTAEEREWLALQLGEQ